MSTFGVHKKRQPYLDWRQVLVARRNMRHLNAAKALNRLIRGVFELVVVGVILVIVTQ